MIAELESEPVAVILLGQPGRRSMRGEPPHQPLLGLAPQLLALVARARRPSSR